MVAVVYDSHTGQYSVTTDISYPMGDQNGNWGGLLEDPATLIAKEDRGVQVPGRQRMTIYDGSLSIRSNNDLENAGKVVCYNSQGQLISLTGSQVAAHMRGENESGIPYDPFSAQKTEATEALKGDLGADVRELSKYITTPELDFERTVIHSTGHAKASNQKAQNREIQAYELEVRWGREKFSEYNNSR